MQQSSKPAVVARNLSKTYVVTKDGSERGARFRRNTIRVEALQPMSFVANKGEAIGIIGKNGSGKSTLLNMVAGHEQPTTGDIWVSARPSLLSVNAAMQQHLTGRQNIRLGLLASGLSPERVTEIENDVAEWAEIGDAVNRPLNTYSSGMGARLKFSIATAVRPEILMIDEALATGDSTFTQRAQERMQEFLDNASTVFIVSHSPGTIRANCARAIWLHHGETLVDGEAGWVSAQYKRWSDAEAARDRTTANKLIRRVAAGYQSPNIVFDSVAEKLLNRVVTDQDEG